MKLAQKLAIGLLAVSALLRSASAQTRPTPTNFNATVPVYQISQLGATGAQGSNLANGLNIPLSDLVLSNGLVTYLGSGFLTFPTNYAGPPPWPTNLITQTSNQFPQIPILGEGINFAALSNLTVFSDQAALVSSSQALNAAGLSPAWGTPLVDHAMLTAFYSSPTGAMVSNTLPIDTAVEYQFADPNGYPITGPGAQIQLSYGSNGSVSRLHFAASQMTAGTKTVQLMSGAQASNLVSSLFPPGAAINFQAVYWCPHLPPVPECPTCPLPTWHPTNIIPWYYCTGTLNKGPIGAGPGTTVTLMPQMIPATFDTNYVPAPILSLSTLGSNVTANVSVTGGSPPYSYLWGGSDPTVSSNTGPSITYTPVIRVGVPTLLMVVSNGTVTVMWPYPSTGFVLQTTPSLASNNWTQVTNEVYTNPTTGLNMVTNDSKAAAQFFRLALTSPTVPVAETVTVTVTDANGIGVPAVQSIVAQAVPIEGSSQDPAIDYGCESPYDPGLGSNDRASWLTGMSAPGGGSQRFCWTGSAAWPGDFIEPVTPGVLGAGPWAIGDADHNNWGVNSACIVLYIGHGNPNLFTFTIYGNDRSINTCGFVDPESWLWEALFQEVDGVAVNLPAACGGPQNNYDVPNYIGSWRNGGPTVNDNLYWLCLLSCEVLQEYDSSSTGAWTRWGPAFNCLHILTGFDTDAFAGTGFPKQFADNMLLSSDTVVQAWLAAAHAKGTGTAAAMGPIGPGGLWDYHDHYWGKGAVGASIPANEIRGWWYIKWPWTAPVTFP